MAKLFHQPSEPNMLRTPKKIVARSRVMLMVIRRRNGILVFDGLLHMSNMFPRACNRCFYK